MSSPPQTRKVSEMRKYLLASTILCGLSSAAQATTYYVSSTGKDSNSGTSTASPLLTVGAAAKKTNPGDTVLLMTGNYPPVIITRSGTAAAWITYQPAPGQHPVIHKDGTAWNGVDIQANYITLTGLEVLGNAQSITQDQANAASSSNNTTNGHCASVAKASHHVKILNNTLAYCPGAGIIFWGDYGWIERNIVHHNSYWSHLAESGIVVIPTNPISPPGKVYVDGNLVYSNQTFVCNSEVRPCRITDGNGIIVDSNIRNSPPTGYSGRIEIYNNIIYNNGGWGLVDAFSQHVDIYNNTTWHNGLSVFDPRYAATGGEIGLNKADDVRVWNNILFASTGGVVISPGFPTITNYTWDYNLMFNGITPTLGTAPIGPHDIVADPQFTTWMLPPAAFKVQEGSPAFNRGSAVPPTDFANLPRQRPDIGAYRVDW